MVPTPGSSVSPWPRLPLPPSVPAQGRDRLRSLRYNGLVHVHAYRVKLEPLLYYPAALTAEVLAERLAGDAVIHEFAPHPSGSHIVTIGLQRDRDSHEEALNELLFAAQELGYTFAEGVITRVADRAIEMAVGLGLGGLGAGSTTENGEIAALGAALGWVVGLFVGANMKNVEVLYRAQWTSQVWHLIRVAPQRAPSRPALQAG